MCQANYQILIFLVPSYLFIIAYFIRTFTLRSHQLSPKLIDRTRWFDDEEDNYSPVKDKLLQTPKPTTLLIKIALSQGICFSYFVDFIIGFLVSENIFFISCEKFLNFAYLIALFSWWNSAALLRKEFEKDQPQACYSHRFFWISAFFFQIFAFFLTKDYLLNFISNLLKMFLMFPLFLFAIFKPNDKSPETFSVKLAYLDNIENNCLFVLLIRFCAYPDQIHNLDQKPSPISPMVNKSSPCSSGNKESPTSLMNPEGFKINLINLPSETSPKTLMGSNNSLPPINQERYLHSLIPRKRSVTINRTPFLKRDVENNEVIYYQVITQMDYRLYTADRNYHDFIELQKELFIIFAGHEVFKFNAKNVDFPSPSFDQRKFVESLEKYLQAILQNVACINVMVLKFLNVAPEDQTPFIKYQELNLKNNNYKTSIKGKAKTLHITRQSSNNSDSFSLTTSPARALYAFEIVCLNWKKISGREETIVQFEFQIMNNYKKPPQIWRIYKKYSDIKKFHEELENHLHKQLNIFNDLVPRASNYSLLSDEFLEQRKRGLEKYLQMVLSCRTYYCNELYDFVEYDVDADKPMSHENDTDSYALSVSLDGINKSDKKIDTFNFIFDDEPSEKLILDLSRATPRHLKPFKQQRLFSEAMSPYFKTEEKRWISGINFNFVSVKLLFIKSVNPKRDILSSGIRSLGGPQKELLYYINLEEFAELARGKFKTRTLIKMVKKYQDFKILNDILWATYKDFDENIVNLPPDLENKNFDPEEMKKKWDDYFYHLMKIPKIEQNESFRDFFNLNRLGPSFEFTRGESEVFDFT